MSKGRARYDTRYYYAVVLLDETPYASGKAKREFSRESGIQYGRTPSAAATTVEAGYNQKNYIVDSITIRLVSENGQVLLQTQKDDMTDQLPLPAATSRLPTQTKKPEKAWDVYKYLTVSRTWGASPPTLKPEVHLT